MCEMVTTAGQAMRQIRLEPTVQAPGHARRFVSEVLDELGRSDLVEAAALIASELVTNSRAAAPNGPIWVDVWQTGAFLDLEIWDCSPKPPELLDPDLLAEGGRGLHIVKQLTRAFGYATFDCGKVVWAILDVTGREQHSKRCPHCGAESG